MAEPQPTSPAPGYRERYDGGHHVSSGKSLRVATGGAGQSGLLKAWATIFIGKCVSEGMDPFYVRTAQDILFLYQA